jgi:hypothetical protein
MPIKFPCPHCERKLNVADNMAGKKARCPACQQAITIPASGVASAQQAAAAAATPSAPAARKAPRPAKAEAAAPPPVPSDPPPPEDVDAEAAALFSDKPAQEEQVEVKEIEFECPMCNEKVKVGADMAGKRTPCPECRRIVKVPELVKRGPKDWRQAMNAPAGAKRPDEPAPEGAWGSNAASVVSRDSLQEADAIPYEDEPLTIRDRIRKGLIWAVGLGVIALLVWLGMRWWGGRAEDRAIAAARAYADQEASRKQIGPDGAAALHRAASEYCRLRKDHKSAEDGKKEFDTAMGLLKPGDDVDSRREIILMELALTQIEMGGSNEEARLGQALKWDDVQRELHGILLAMRSHEAKRELLRQLARRLTEKKQPERALTLAQAEAIFPTPPERADAIGIVGIELVQAGQKDFAAKAADAVAQVYAAATEEEGPAAVASAVTLLHLTGRKPLEIPAGAPEKEFAERVGKVEALAREGKLEEARKLVEASKDPEVIFLSRVALAAALVDASSPEAEKEARPAAQLAAERLKVQPLLTWTALRLVQVGIRAGLSEGEYKPLLQAMPDRQLSGYGQLLILRGKLAASKQIVERSALDDFEANAFARLLAAEALARHNTRLDKGWRSNIDSWDEPLRAFGQAGVALGLRSAK